MSTRTIKLLSVRCTGLLGKLFFLLAVCTEPKIEQKFGIFSKLDDCSFVTNAYDKGNVASIVRDCSPHGTRVAAIANAFFPKESLLNEVPLGSKLISFKIGETLRLDGNWNWSGSGIICRSGVMLQYYVSGNCNVAVALAAQSIEKKKVKNKKKRKKKQVAAPQIM